MSYEPSWDSLKKHITPEWFQKAKFGIYTHWGVYSVPACGPNGSWYPMNMYQKGTPQYEFHKKNFGGCEKFGYKDFIPMFTGAKFNPDEWAALFSEAGAKFAGPVGEHHDGFTMWDTAYSRYNAINMGPKRDVVGELEKAYRQKGMKYMVALHHAENWWFYPHWNKNVDCSNPEYSDLYGEIHDMNLPSEKYMDWRSMQKPSKAFLDKWLGKTREVIDKYSPDMLWFDFGLEYVEEHYKREFLAYYYNKAEQEGRDVVVTYKFNHLAPGSGVVDIELGRNAEMTHHDWITDTTVDDGEAWGYVSGAKYKTAEWLIHYLIDNVSKNGYMLLNVGPDREGQIPDEAKAILKGIGKWLKVNGEAIYDTTAWLYSGEGPTKLETAGSFHDEAVKYTPEDIRFTCKGDTLYAMVMSKPQGSVVIKTLSCLYENEIERVSLLGISENLKWELHGSGLTVYMPENIPDSCAYSIKIERKSPY